MAGPNRVLSGTTVEQIQRDWDDTIGSRRGLITHFAKEYKVSMATISNIVHRKGSYRVSEKPHTPDTPDAE